MICPNYGEALFARFRDIVRGNENLCKKFIASRPLERRECSEKILNEIKNSLSKFPNKDRKDRIIEEDGLVINWFSDFVNSFRL